MRRLLIAFLLCLCSVAYAAVDSGYENAKGYSTSCPDIGQVADVWSFYTCNCTSYVAYRVSQDWARIYGSQYKFTNQYFFSGMNSTDKDRIVVPWPWKFLPKVSTILIPKHHILGVMLVGGGTSPRYLARSVQSHTSVWWRGGMRIKFCKSAT